MLPGCENSTNEPICSDRINYISECDSGLYHEDCDKFNLSWTDLIAPVADERPAAPNTNSIDGNILTNSLVLDDGVDNPAAQYCYDLVSGGYSNWYLPSISELNNLFTEYSLGGELFDSDVFMGFKRYRTYWSSTQAESDYSTDYKDALGQQIFVSTNDIKWKSNKVSSGVRCIRTYDSGGAVIGLQ
jgi:hypothetical protein